MTEKPAAFVRVFGTLAVLCFGLSTGACVTTWDRIAETVMPKSQAVAQKPDAAIIEIAALPDLPDMETASGGDPGEQAAISHIEQLGDDVLAALGNSAIDTDQREAVFRTILARDLDIELIARFVLGRHWKKASEDQQKRYTSVFSEFLVQTYATRLGGVRIDDFHVDEDRQQRHPRALAGRPWRT
ncbi:MAG: ABC transporter substrate-binding protein [Rhodospirillales bacterium]|nr:ABC transporter substrate-binding protein [Rhodospirillales bacterium]